MLCALQKLSRLFEGIRTFPHGGDERLSTPDDICFLVEKEAVWAEMLADVLRQEKVPFLQEGRMGAGMATKTGYMTERYRFFVARKDLPKARDIVIELFGGTEK